MNVSLKIIDSCMEFLDCVNLVCDTEYEELQFLDTTKENLELYSENFENFSPIEKDFCKEPFKAIIDNQSSGLVVATKNNKVIAYARFELSDSLVNLLPENDICPLELAELYVAPKERNSKYCKNLFKIIKNIAHRDDNIDSIILSISKKRNKKYNLLEIYKKMGFNNCYFILDNSPINRSLPSVVHESTDIPAGRKLEGYILLSEI
jgi:hypothetical protein